jgi:hypothetical protein
MGGELLIHIADMRLCDAHVEHDVMFGFGLLGVLSHKTYFSLARKGALSANGQTSRININLDGSVLLLKSLSRDVDSSFSDFRPVGCDLRVAQAAAAIVRSNPSSQSH